MNELQTIKLIPEAMAKLKIMFTEVAQVIDRHGLKYSVDPDFGDESIRQAVVFSIIIDTLVINALGLIYDSDEETPLDDYKDKFWSMAERTWTELKNRKKPK